MFKFLYKKFWIDFSRNFLTFFFLNLFYVLCLLTGTGICFLSLSLIPDPDPLFLFPGMILILFITNIYMGAAAGVVNDIADYKSPLLKAFWKYLKSSLLNSVLFSLLGVLFISIFTYSLSIAFFSRLTPAPLIIAFILWAGLIWLISSQFFYAIHYRLEKKFFKILKIMIQIFLDNMAFSFVCFFSSVLLCLLSAPAFLIIPGLVSLQLFLGIALKLRLYKYDYQAKSLVMNTKKAEIKKNKSGVPWPELLLEDIQKTADRISQSVPENK